MIRSKEDIFKEVAERTGHSEELVKFVVKNLWKTVHSYLVEPLACGRGVIFRDVFYIKPKPVFLGRAISKLQAAEIVGCADDYMKARLHYFKQIAKYLEQHEKSAWRRLEHARFRAYLRYKPRWEEIKAIRASGKSNYTPRRYRIQRPGSSGQDRVQSEDQ